MYTQTLIFCFDSLIEQIVKNNNLKQTNSAGHNVKLLFKAVQSSCTASLLQFMPHAT